MPYCKRRHLFEYFVGLEKGRLKLEMQQQRSVIMESVHWHGREACKAYRVNRRADRML